jgi:hypothetical protein
VPELLILADVLGVPPLMLLFPVGWEQATEVLPGTVADPWHAAQWFMGYTGDPAVPGAERPPEGRALWYWQENDRYAAIIRDAHERLGKAVDAYETALAKFGATTADTEHHRLLAQSEARHLSTAVTALRSLRQSVAEAGLLPPPLPSDAAHVLDIWGRHPETEPKDRPAGGDALGVLVALAKQGERAHKEEPDGAR